MDLKEKKMKKLLSKVKEKIRPSDKEKKEVMKLFREFKKKLSKEIKNEIVLLGSVAKDTFLKGEKDLDVFVLFDIKEEKEKCAEKIFNSLKKLKMKFYKKYAEHPYARVAYKGIEIDLVPAYKIKEGDKIKSAVDRTIFHYKYVKKNLKEKQKDEVRLLKKMLKNFGIYGAEVGIGGFSGYLCELLVIKYGDFINVLKAASEWKEREKISLTHKNTIELFKEPLVFIDPTDAYRNVASPVSKENLSKFIVLSRSFLNSPEESYFFIEKLKKKPENEFGKNVVIYSKAPEVVEETRNGQLKRIEKALKNYLRRKGFMISNSFIHSDKKYSYISLSSPNELPEIIEIKGPEIWRKKDVEKFMKKNTSYIEEGRVIGIKKITKRTLEENIKQFIKQYNFPSYYRRGFKIMKKINKDLKNKTEIEMKRYYLMVGRWKKK